MIWKGRGSGGLYVLHIYLGKRASGSRISRTKSVENPDCSRQCFVKRNKVESKPRSPRNETCYIDEGMQRLRARWLGGTEADANIVHRFDSRKSATVPWLRRLGIVEHMRALKEDEIKASFALPPASDQRLKELKDHIIRDEEQRSLSRFRQKYHKFRRDYI
jgi:hypothetical protein